MKILQLNAWNGRVKGALAEFLKSNDFDVACLQEMVWGGNQEIMQDFILPTEKIREFGRFTDEAKAANFGIEMSDKIVKIGNVVFSKKAIKKNETKYVYGEYKIVKTLSDIKHHAYTVQLIKLENGVNIVNHHGYWLPTPVGDEITVEVMTRVADLVKKLEGPVIMCGDLNVIHSSLAMRALDFLHDLTEEYKVRNTLVGLKFDGRVACDHILVNDEIKVKSFEVLDDLISDHKALVAEIEIK